MEQVAKGWADELVAEDPEVEREKHRTQYEREFRFLEFRNQDLGIRMWAIGFRG